MFGFVVFFLATLSFICAAPDVTYVSPTPASGAITTSTTVTINSSITEPNLKMLVYNWDGTNFTFYNASLLFFMNFDNRSGLGENRTRVVDLSHYSTNGTVSGGAAWNSSGKYGGAYSFNGNGGIITDQSVMNNLIGFTMAGWVNVGTTGSRISLFGQNDAVEFGFSDANTLLLWTSNGGSVSWTINSTLFPLNTWNFLTVVGQNYSAPFLNLYINGVSQATGGTNVSNFGSSTYNFSIGTGVFDATGGNVTGAVDDVMVFNRSLSSVEIYQLYVSSLTKVNITSWQMSVVQAKNVSEPLSYKDYTYYVAATNSSNSYSPISIQTLSVSRGSDGSVPEFRVYGLFLIIVIAVGSFFVMKQEYA